MAKKDKSGVDTTDESQTEVTQSPAEASVDTTDESAKSESDPVTDESSKDEVEKAKDAIFDTIADAEKVIVIVPKAFNLTLPKGVVLQIKAGTQTVDKFIAEHWYSKANGMKIFNPEA